MSKLEGRLARYFLDKAVDRRSDSAFSGSPAKAIRGFRRFLDKNGSMISVGTQIRER